MKINKKSNPCAIVRAGDLTRYTRPLRVKQRRLEQKYGLPSSPRIHNIGTRLCMDGLSYEVQEKLYRFDQVLSERVGRGRRWGGEPEIDHPRRIVNQMIEDGIRDEVLLLAGLGHDAVEDKYMTLDEIEQLCGKEARDLIDGVTKLGKEMGKEKREKANFIKFTEAACVDPRVIILKVYDNLDNWRDQHVFLKYVGFEHKPREHAEETKQIYARFMKAYNFWLMRVRLEDRALQYFDPNYETNLKVYNEAVSRCRDKIEEIAAKIQQTLDAEGIPAKATHRVKNYSEVYDSCDRKGICIPALFESAPLFAHYISVVIEDGRTDIAEEERTAACHQARGIVDVMGHQLNLFVPEEKDKSNLLKPRENGYRALHTYASLPGEGIFMIGYTTRDYDLENRFGAMLARGIKSNFAEGWQITDTGWLSRLRDMLRKEKWMTVKEIRDRVPRMASPITVYSPTREKRVMDGGSTALDYALAADHLNVGRIFVNGIKVEPDTELRSNDVIRVEEDPNSNPHPLWLLSVNTHEAAGKIRGYLRNSTFGRQRGGEVGSAAGIEALDQMVAKRFLKWKDIESTSQVREMLEYFSEKHKERIESLIKEGVIERFMMEGKVLTPLAMEIMMGIGEIDVEEAENKFDEIYEASLERRKGEGQTTMYAVLFKVPQNCVGLQEEIGRDLKAIGFDIVKDQSWKNRDGSAGFAYVFDILSTIQQRQIENIIRKHQGEMLAAPVRDKMNGLDFKLSEWLAKHGIVI